MYLLQTQGGMSQYGFLIIMLVFMVFFLILPQRKKAKKEKEFMNALKKGDAVVTNAGIHGKIVELNDEKNTCVVETMAGKIKFEKTAISSELTEKLNAKK
jgi:preprotein translocase subunit YajC